MLTISGAYGRDYASKAKILADWNAGRDFVIRTFGPDDGRYINIDGAIASNITVLTVRYKADRNVCVIQLRGADTRGVWK